MCIIYIYYLFYYWIVKFYNFHVIFIFKTIYVVYIKITFYLKDTVNDNNNNSENHFSYQFSEQQ